MDILWVDGSGAKVCVCMHRRYNKLPVHVYTHTHIQEYVESGIDNESKKRKWSNLKVDDNQNSVD